MELTRMAATPPQLFAAGSDALTTIAPVVEDRLKAKRAHEALSRSTDGSFQQGEYQHAFLKVPLAETGGIPL